MTARWAAMTRPTGHTDNGSPHVVYSVPARLGGSGIGWTAYQAVSGIQQAGLLGQALANSSMENLLPSRLVRHWGSLGHALKYLSAHESSGLLDHMINLAFDAWVAQILPHGDIFHGWNGACLRSLRQAKRRGMITIVERASSHPTTQRHLLEEEYQRWRIRRKLPAWNYEYTLCELEETDYITIPSSFVRTSMLAAGISADRLIEIPFGVDLERFRPTLHRPANRFRVAFAGQVSIRKGVPYLLEAWQRLGWTDAELWLIGRITADFAAIHQRWEALDKVRLLGHSTHLASLLQQVDVFVFPTIEEGSALVTYEALASGLPVITTPNAGSIVRDGIDGFIVPIRDTLAICEKLQLIRSDPDLRQRISESARARAAQYPWACYQSSLIESYRRLMERSRPEG